MAVATVNVASGFHSDATKLLKRFAEAEVIQMSEFTKIWRDMKFMKVFLYRESIEIVMFTEECFRILLRIVLGQDPLPFRVGGFYCLYSMYLMQPSQPVVKIRLVPDMWRGLLRFIDECQLESWENEIKYVFWTLAYSNAFLFVAKPNAIGLVSTSAENDSTSSITFPNMFEDYMSTDHQFLCDIHNRYMSIKDSLNPSSAKTVQMVDRSLFTVFEEQLATLQEKHNSGKDFKQSKTDTSQSDDDNNYSSEESRSSDNEDDENTLERRRKIRKKHQASQAAQNKSRRHRVTNKAPAATKKKRGRPRDQTSSNNDPDYGDRPFQHLDSTMAEVELNAETT